VSDLTPTGELVISKEDIEDILKTSELNEKLFLEIINIAIQACYKKDIDMVEKWLRNNYINFRHNIPVELRHMYLRYIEYPSRKNK
jgi:hypothetical protein